MECNNCYEFYNNTVHLPLNLECGHTFCKNCITNIIKNCTKLECPICRKRISPFLNISKLSKNFLALEMTKKLKEIKNVLDFCLKHPYEPLRFFCKSCKEEVCSDCLILHSGHFLEKQEFSKNIIKGKILRIKVNLEKEEKVLKNKIVNLEKKVNILKKNYDSEEKKLEIFKKDLVFKIKENENKLMMVYTKNVKLKENSLIKIENLMKNILQEMSNQILFITKLEKKLKNKKCIRDENLINELENLENGIQKKIEESTKLKIIDQNEFLKINPNENFKKKISKIGKISEEENSQSIIFFGSENYILVYSIQKNEWDLTRRKLNIDLSFKNYSSAVNVNNSKILLIGGGFSDEILEFDKNDLSLKKKNNMLKKRTEHCTLFINGFIYILGGYDKKETKFLKSCEIFDFDNNKFLLMEDMKIAKCGFSASFLNGDIYTIGGFDGQKRLDCIEKYNLVNNTWEMLTIKLQEGLTNTAALTINQTILILGGGNEKGFSKQIFEINFEKGEIKKKSEMKNGRDLRNKIFLQDEEIFVIGGPGFKSEIYNFLEDKWVEIKSYDKLMVQDNLDSWSATVCLDFKGFKEIDGKESEGCDSGMYPFLNDRIFDSDISEQDVFDILY